ncbi:MAG: hypothetical protein ABIN97_10520 [Ginsengibacter sp.]
MKFTDQLFFFQQLKGENTSLADIKYFNRWKYYLQPGRNPVTERLPWINFPAIDFLKKNLNPADTVFEFGAGGSTLFFLDRVKKLITAEHKTEWYDTLKKIITQKELYKWEGVLIPPELKTETRQLNISDPNDYYSSDDAYINSTFKNYVTYIDRFSDGFFNVILIDGRARPSCIKHAVKKLRRNGLLILDNADREYYLTRSNEYLHNFHLLQNHFAPIPFVAPFVQTNIYKRIK